MPRILIVNSVSANTGDAAILLGLMEWLTWRYPAADFVVADDYPDLARKVLPRGVKVVSSLWRQRHGRTYERFIRRLRPERLDRDHDRLLQSLARSAPISHYGPIDMMVSTGGTYLTGNYDIRPRLLEFAVARALDVPLILAPQTIHGLQSSSLQAALGHAWHTFSREGTSRTALQDMLVPGERWSEAPDVAFALTGPAGRSGTKSGPIAFSVRDWPYAESERPARVLTDVISELALQGHQVLLISTCQGLGRSYSFDDARAASNLVSKMPISVRRNVVIDSAWHTPMQLMDKLRECRAVVSTRFHMAILAMLAGSPAVVLEYEPKAIATYTAMGLSEFALPLNTMEASQVAGRLADLLASPEEVEARVEAGVAHQRRRLYEALNQLPSTG